MPKAFLSHSSDDKGSYVSVVARRLGKSKVVYDEWTFEEGIPSADEIRRTLSASDLFVLFLSESALESRWVKREILQAKKRLSKDASFEVFPIICDSSLQHDDPRLPEWLRRYNLRFISRPALAARRVLQRLRMISWKQHPRIKDRQKIFVGRNDILSRIEERLDNVDMNRPLCLIASGIGGMGRRSTLLRSLIKSNTVESYYRPPIIHMDSADSIEDFIIKVYDLGFSSNIETSNLINKSMNEKAQLASELIKDVNHAREVLFVIDDNSLFRPNRSVAKWFAHTLDFLENFDAILCCVAARSKFSPRAVNHSDQYFGFDVHALRKTERLGLLRRLSEFEGLHLSSNDVRSFSEVLSGSPEQILFTVSLIKEEGLERAQKNTSEIVAFNRERIQEVLSDFDNNEDAKQLLNLLSYFPFISYEVLFGVMDENDEHHEAINRFLYMGLCENIGANGEFIKIDDAVRDVVSRQDIDLPERYKKRLAAHVDEFLKTKDISDADASDILFTVKEAVKTGKKVDSKIIVPSHFLRTIQDLYDKAGRYSDIVEFADRALEYERSFDEELAEQIHRYKVLSLARLGDARCLDEIHARKTDDFDFLMGFYYRQVNNSVKAIRHQENHLRRYPNSAPAKRELVQNYINIHEYETAFILAEETYRQHPDNPYHIHAYFVCLVHNRNAISHKGDMEDLLDRLSKIHTEKAEEIWHICKATYESRILQHNEEAKLLLRNAISKYPHSRYPRIALLDLLLYAKMYQEIPSVLDQFHNVSPNDELFNTTEPYRAFVLASQGQLVAAERVINGLRNCPDGARSRFIERVNEIVSERFK